MVVDRTDRRAATAGLVLVTAIWGSTFFLIKGAVASHDPLDFLSVRFLIAAVIVALVFHRRLRRLGRREWLIGLGLGAVYGIAQVLQTWGLTMTDASVSGFITGTYVIITPLLLWLVLRRTLGVGVWGAVVLALGGLAVLGLTGVSGGFGELITFLGAAVYAVHIVLLEKPSKQIDALALTAVQMVGIAAVCTVMALPDGITAPSGDGVWFAVLYTAVMAGVITMALQTWAQARISPTRVALLMTLEPVFASVFAIALGGESLTWRLMLGGSLILGAMALGILSDRDSAAPMSEQPQTAPALSRDASAKPHYSAEPELHEPPLKITAPRTITASGPAGHPSLDRSTGS